MYPTGTIHGMSKNLDDWYRMSNTVYCAYEYINRYITQASKFYTVNKVRFWKTSRCTKVGVISGFPSPYPTSCPWFRTWTGNETLAFNLQRYLTLPVSEPWFVWSLYPTPRGLQNIFATNRWHANFKIHLCSDIQDTCGCGKRRKIASSRCSTLWREPSP